MNITNAAIEQSENSNVIQLMVVDGKAQRKPEKLYKQYYPLHETSLSNAVVKIYNIYHLEKLSAHRAKRIY